MGNVELVMAEIEWLTSIVLAPSLWLDVDIARSNAMLTHLTEMHKLRDEAVYRFIEQGLVIETLDKYTVTHPNYTLLLQM